MHSRQFHLELRHRLFQDCCMDDRRAGPMRCHANCVCFNGLGSIVFIARPVCSAVT